MLCLRQREHRVCAQSPWETGGLMGAHLSLLSYMPWVVPTQRDCKQPVGPVHDPNKAGRIAKGKCPALDEGRGEHSTACPLVWQLHHTHCCNTKPPNLSPSRDLSNTKLSGQSLKKWAYTDLFTALAAGPQIKLGGISVLAQSSCITPAGRWQQRWNCTQLLSALLARSFWGGEAWN